MTSNPFLIRLLGESVPNDLTSQQEMPPEKPDAPSDAPSDADGEIIPDQTSNTASGPPSTAAPITQELVQQWKRGQRMEVATKLMFTEASYGDFVDLVFQIGHSDGKVLGQMLDELADSEDIHPPKTPPEYEDTLRRAVGAEQEENIV